MMSVFDLFLEARADAYKLYGSAPSRYIGSPGYRREVEAWLYNHINPYLSPVVFPIMHLSMSDSIVEEYGISYFSRNHCTLFGSQVWFSERSFFIPKDMLNDPLLIVHRHWSYIVQ